MLLGIGDNLNKFKNPNKPVVWTLMTSIQLRLLYPTQETSKEYSLEHSPLHLQTHNVILHTIHILSIS